MNLPALFAEHNIIPKGVIHVGAHTGEELATYVAMGFERIIFVEANPAVFPLLAQHIMATPTKLANGKEIEIQARGCAISDHNGMEMLKLTSATMSSSLLPMKDHRDMYPGITDAGEVLVPVCTLDSLLQTVVNDSAIMNGPYNFLHLDIQGAELMALRGATYILPRIEAMVCELNFREMYEGCALAVDVDAALSGMTRVQTVANESWGDGFYVRKRDRWVNLWQTHPGNHGRLANQMFQYAFARLFADRHGYELRTFPWSGQQLFGLTDPRVSEVVDVAMDVTPYVEDSALALSLAPEWSEPLPDKLCLQGLFQYHTKWWAKYRERLVDLFRPVPELEKVLRASFAKLMTNHGDLVVVHMRRGDYVRYDAMGHPMFYVTDSELYCQWMDEIAPTLDRPLFYIASDDPELVQEMRRRLMVNAADLHLPFLGEEVASYVDFWMMTQADALAISNSTYSFLASMLNARGRVFVRPVKGGLTGSLGGGLVSYDPWDADVLLGRAEDEAMRKRARERSLADTPIPYAPKNSRIVEYVPAEKR